LGKIKLYNLQIHDKFNKKGNPPTDAAATWFSALSPADAAADAAAVVVVT
jgi:hypothetical protein